MISSEQKIQIPPIPADAEIRLAKPPEAPSISPPKDHLAWVDGLRAVACIMVIVCHTSQHFPWRWGVFSVTPYDTTYTLILTNADGVYGYSGVGFFLVLSGFCLYWPFTKPGYKDPTLKNFLFRRWKRIAPACYVACAISAYLAVNVDRFTDAKTAESWLLSKLFFLNVENFQVILGQTWSLALEWQCYFMFPLFVVAIRQFGVRPVVLTAIALNALYRIWMAQNINLADDWAVNFNLFYTGLGRCADFVIGMASAAAVREKITTGKLPLRKSDSIIAFLAALQIYWSVKHDLLNTPTVQFAPFTDAAIAVIFGSVVLAASEYPRIKNIFSWKPLVWFGSISYSIYLVHGAVIYYLGANMLHVGKWGNWIPTGQVLLIILCALFAYPFYLLFEKPFLNTKN